MGRREEGASIAEKFRGRSHDDLVEVRRQTAS
jgi:hypothetical protein